MIKTSRAKGWGAIIAAFLAATLVGSFALSLEAAVFVALNALDAGGPDAATVAGQALLTSTTGLLFVAPVFLVGLLVVGAPVWLIIGATQVRSRLVATLVGAVLAGVTAAIILMLFGLMAGGAPAIGAAALTLPGAAAGWTLHRVAYGRTPTS